MRNRPFLLLFKIYSLFILFFLCCRIYLTFLSWADIPSESLSLIPEMIIRGTLFDMVFLNAAFFLPLLLFTFQYLLKSYPKWTQNSLRYYFNLVAVLFIAGAFADITYYNYYGLRLTIGIFTWIDTPDLMFSEVFSNLNYLILMAIESLLVFLFNRLQKQLFKKHLTSTRYTNSIGFHLVQFGLLGLLLFTGVRGSLNFSEHPKEIKDSLFSKYPILNNLTLNGLFNLVYSTPQKDLKLMAPNEAEIACKTQFNIPLKNASISRYIKPDNPAKKKNVVLIIMESMTGYQLSSYGKSKGYVPFFEDLTKRSLFFPNLYTSGIHTHNGIYSSLWGHPAILNQKPMVEATKTRQQFYGLPHILKEKGYETFFFSPGDPRFDNMMSFVSSNGFDHFTSQKDFDDSQILNKWGIPDHTLFLENIAPIDKAYKNDQPFFATYLTISTHAPYTIPHGIDFKPRQGTTDARDIAYEYADWSLQQFFETIKGKPWYKETIFALVADHGQIFERRYDIPLTYHHCPFVLFDPELNPIKKDPKIAMQLDVFPTILGYLNVDYINNGFGINLLKESRPYAFFTADTKIGVIDSTHYYINNLNGPAQLFDYKTLSTDNIASSYPEKVAEMEKYSLSQLQWSYEMIKNNHTKKPQ